MPSFQLIDCHLLCHSIAITLASLRVGVIASTNQLCKQQLRCNQAFFTHYLVSNVAGDPGVSFGLG